MPDDLSRKEIFLLQACGYVHPKHPGDNEDNDDGSGTVKPGNGKILIAWFSRWGNTNYASDVDASTGASIIIDKGTRRGTTEVVARLLSTTRIYRSNLRPITFDPVHNDYLVIGEKVGNAFKDGAALK